MTCVATDGRTIAADGMMTDRGIIMAVNHPKVARLTDGRLFGACGDCAGAIRLRAWIEDPKGPFPKLPADTQALVLNLDGTLDSCEEAARGRRSASACRLR